MPNPCSTTTTSRSRMGGSHYSHSGGGEAESVVRCPKCSVLYNQCHASSSTTGSTPREKSKKRKPDDEVVRMKITRWNRILKPQNDLSPEFLWMIRPDQPVFLYRNQLSDMDVDIEQNQLLVWDTFQLNKFLTEDECAMLKFKVVAIDMNGREYKMSLTKWGEDVFVFNSEWSFMLRTNGVVANDFVDLWGFRRGGWSIREFCLAVVFTRV